MPAPGLRSGKIPAGLLSALLAELPPGPPELLLGPAVGEDAGAFEVGGEVVVVASDPVTLTDDGEGFVCTVINANDVAVTGATPRWFVATILVPPGTAESRVRAAFADILRGLDLVGAYLVGGHTEITAAVAQPVIVGQMLGLAENGKVIPTGGAEAGDIVVQLGPVPIEGAAVLARRPELRAGSLEPELLEAAAHALERPGISIVAAALLAARLQATALHDPTEGGLAAGLHELAHASGLALRIDASAVLWFEPGVAVCRAVGADPWSTLASGAVLATFPPDRVDTALHELVAHGYAASAIGRAERGSGVRVDDRELAWPERDEVARVARAPSPGTGGGPSG